MSCNDRKITCRMTRKHEHILKLLIYKDGLTKTQLCNKIINKAVHDLINYSKELSEKGYEYYTAFSAKSTMILSQFYSMKRSVLSFRLTKKNEELLYSHFIYFDEDNNIKNPDKSTLNKIISQLIFYHLDGENLDDLCEYAGISSDEIWHFINKI